MKPESPINEIPPIVLVLGLLIIGIECTFQLANYGLIGGPRGLGWRLDAVAEYGFSGAVFDQVLQGNYSFDMLKRFVTYVFINAEFTQMLFAAALTLALGKFTGEYYGGLRVLVVYIFASVIGAIIFALFAEPRFPLYGGFAPVYGLIGAYTYALWLRLGRAGEKQIQAFRLIGVLLAIQLLYGLIFGSSLVWIAELSGFFAGFGLSVLLAPGGWATFLARMRERG